jgi:hypothetical protein
VAKNGGALAAGAVTVRPRTFPTQQLTLPKGMVDLDAPALARVETERGELKSALAAGASERLWRGPFRAPVEGGQPTGGFGLRGSSTSAAALAPGYDWAGGDACPRGERRPRGACHRALLRGRNVVDHASACSPSTTTYRDTRPAGEPDAPGYRHRGTGRVTARTFTSPQLNGARVDPEAPAPGPTGGNAQA